MWQKLLISLIIFLTAFADLGLAIFVFRKGPQKRVNRAFAIFSSVTFLWAFADFLSYISSGRLFLLRSAFAFSSLVPIAGFFFALALTNKHPKKILNIAVIITGIFFFSICFTDLIIKDVPHYYITGFELVAGIFYVPWVMYMTTISTIGVSVLLLSYRFADRKGKQQIKYFLLGAAALALWSNVVSVVFPLFSITLLANLDAPGSLFLTGFTSYTIIQYQLFGIKSLFFKAFIYALVVAVISVVLAALMVFGSWFFNNLGFASLWLVALFISTFIFIIGRSFFNKTRDLEIAKINLTDAFKRSEKERMGAEKEKNKTLAIITNFSDGLLILDEDSRIFLVNPMAEKYLDLKSAKLVGKKIIEFEKEPELKNVFSLLEGFGQIFSKKEVEIRKNLILEISFVPMAYNKRNIGSLIVLHNITQQKMVEKMKSDFVSLAAHQLRTPASAIKWATQMLISGTFGKMTKQQTETLQRTYKTNEKMIRLISDLLNVAQIEEGKYISKLHPADIETVIESALESAQEIAGNKNIKIQIKKLKDVPEMMIDEGKIKIAASILLENAAEYTPQNGEITIYIEPKLKELEIRVKDNGYGIPKQEQEKVFSKFFRGTNVVKIDTEGTGLGLFIAKNIIESHGGEIWFESQENEGTTFCFTLPMNSPSAV